MTLVVLFIMCQHGTICQKKEPSPSDFGVVSTVLNSSSPEDIKEVSGAIVSKGIQNSFVKTIAKLGVTPILTGSGAAKK